MGVVLQPADLADFVSGASPSKLAAMISDVEARALEVAPCLPDINDLGRVASAKAILRQAVIRWAEAGSGAVVQRQQTAGPFSLGESYDTRTDRKPLLWPSELSDLAALCRDQRIAKAATRWLA